MSREQAGASSGIPGHKSARKTKDVPLRTQVASLQVNFGARSVGTAVVGTSVGAFTGESVGSNVGVNVKGGSVGGGVVGANVGLSVGTDAGCGKAEGAVALICTASRNTFLPENPNLGANDSANAI